MPADPSTDLLLLTCANCKQCNHVIPFLLPKWKHLRIVVNSVASREQLVKNYADSESSIEVLKADLAQPNDCKRILKGVTTLYHIGPSLHPMELEIGKNMIEAAIHHKLQHFVFSSVLHTQLRKILQHDCKRYIEEALIESGVPYTILQPGHFMDNFPLQKLLFSEAPTCTARWGPDIPFSYTSLVDLGDAAAKVLEEREKHFHATYQLVSTTPPMGYRQVCEIAGKMIGKQIKVEHMPFHIAMDGNLEAMFGLKPHPSTRDQAQRMLLYYNYRGLVGNNNAMRWLLEREPLSWEEWMEGKMDEVECEFGGKVGGHVCI